MSKKASVKALGCRLNQYEAVEMQGRLEASGYEIVPFGEKADLELSIHARSLMKPTQNQEM